MVKRVVLACVVAGYCSSLFGCAVAPMYNLESARALVVQGAVNQREDYGMTALYDASRTGNLEIARYLLDNGASVDIATDFGVTPLAVAIYMGHTDVVRLLVSRGADVNHQDPNKWTPLIACAHHGNAEMARILIDAGADLTARDENGRSAAYYAADEKKFDVLGVLRKAGAVIHYTGKKGKDIIIAAVSGDKEKVLALIAAGIDPDMEIENQRHLLMYAVDWQWPDVVKQLLARGASADDRDADGWTPMMHAALTNQKETLAAFTAAGVKMPYAGDVRADLLVAVLAGDRDKASSLIAGKGDVNSRYRYNSPLLSYAAKRKDLAMATLLLDQKADPNLANDNGISPFLIALLQKDIPMVGLMLDRGADVNAKNSSGFTALMYAIAYTDAPTVKELLARGARPDANAVILSQGGNLNYPKVNLSEITAIIKPEVLRRQMLRAQAAVEVAQTPADYINAVQEYEIARKLSPDSAEIYYNLGLVQDKAGAYDEAIRNLREYLRLVPAAGDAQAVKDMIYKLEYKRDQAAKVRPR